MNFSWRPDSLLITGDREHAAQRRLLAGWTVTWHTNLPAIMGVWIGSTPCGRQSFSRSGIKYVALQAVIGCWQGVKRKT